MNKPEFIVPPCLVARRRRPTRRLRWDRITIVAGILVLAVGFWWTVIGLGRHLAHV